MKHGKRPTKAQKKRLSEYRLNPDNWLIVKDCKDCFSIVNRLTGKESLVRTMKGRWMNES